MRAKIITAAEAEELQDLMVMRQLIGESLGLPPTAATREVTVQARIALARLAVLDALDAARSVRLDAQISGRAA